MAPEEVWQEQYQQALDTDPVKRLTAAIGAGFTSWIMILSFGFILGFFTRMSGGVGTFKQALGVVSWASIISIGLASLVKLPLILKTESVVEVTLSLAALMPGVEPGSKMFVVLSSFGDFFSWWGLAVVIIGFQRVYNMERSAAVVSVLLPWALVTGIIVGFTVIFM